MAVSGAEMARRLHFAQAGHILPSFRIDIRRQDGALGRHPVVAGEIGKRNMPTPMAVGRFRF
ncbi:hypothetical protein MSKU15_2091 [Komagataeibacter diospyri]|nr:hypothetical protein MSKU15_2091 [Komagataeibacter diospyri]